MSATAAAQSVEDAELVGGLLAGLVPDLSSVRIATFDGEPRSKTRHRLNPRGGVWTPSAPDEDALALMLRVVRGSAPPMRGPVALAAVFYRGNRQRRDTDNMVKLVLDAGTKAALWGDDSQVTAIVAIVEWDPDLPRSVIAWTEHVTSFPLEVPLAICPSCGREFRVLGDDGHRRRFCSTSCRGSSIRQEKRRPGQGRGPKGQPPTSCRDCGRPISKRSYVRCRECWRRARAEGIS
jgi:crossover junction endodeoxyribonuclease RusA